MSDFRLNVAVDDFGRIRERVISVGAGMERARSPASQKMAERLKEQITDNLGMSKGGIHWVFPLIPIHWRQGKRNSGINGGLPATQYGDLADSQNIRQTKAGNATLEVGTGLDRPYARWLELGFTTPGGWGRKFPFMRLSLEQITPELRGICESVIRSEIG